MIYTLLDTGETDISVEGTAVTACGRMARNNEALVQSEVVGTTADIKLEGRMTANSAWTEIDTTTYAATNGSIRVALFPQMRASLENITSGTVTKGLVNLYTI